MKRLVIQFVLLCVFGGQACAAESERSGHKPNVLLILADDLGYGDVRCYNRERGKIATPHIDALAAQGMRFTDAHTSSGVCSPTRYALLTGRYHWRTRLQAGIVGYLGEPLIAPGRLTLAGLLKQQGYRTAAIGKWHLGWDFQLTDAERMLLKKYGGQAGGGGKVASGPTDADRAAWRTIYSREFRGGPTAVGFDSYFGTDVPNWPPYCFIENTRTVGIPQELLPADALKKHQASLQGPALAGWKLDDVLPTLGDRACAFIEDATKKPEPFFLYLPLTSPHTPIATSAEWRGKSGLSDYADFVMQTDDVVGRVLATLERSGAAKDTLVLFTSDNGCAPYIGVKEMEARGHFPSGPWRGYKADAWEGGHRVPFIVRWPSVVAPGTRCDALVQQTDAFATLAATLDVTIPEAAGEDSVSLLPLLRGGSQAVREFAISHASSGLPALRRDSWKIIFGSGGGGFSAEKNPGSGQLYDLATDPGETKNLWDEKPELVAELTADMERLVNAHPNDVEVKWRRFLAAAQATQPAPNKSPAVKPAAIPRETRDVSGWQVHIQKKLLETEPADTERALVLLKQMLDAIVRDVPAPAVAELRKVPLYFSPAYKPGKSGVEFHPGADWLRNNGRDPAMVRAVEFSGVANFEAEMKRMPNFALHELAHAYHHRVLADGFANAEIKAAFERAKTAGSYERVERWHGNGKPNTFERAYAMTNPMEYFAETTEAFFSRNDFFPFTREELKQHDPEMFALLAKLWSVKEVE